MHTLVARLAALTSVVLGLARADAQCQPTWHPAPSGTTGSQEVNGLIYASCRWVPDNGLYTPTRVVAAGTFTQAGSTPTNRIASWDGTAWYAFGSGMNGTVSALATDGTTLYAAGTFTTAGGVACSNIAKWTGTAWQPLGTGVNGGVFAMVVDSGTLFIGGSFTTAGGLAANHVAAWDGFNWNTLGSGVNGTVTAILDDNPAGIVFGGSFTTAGGVAASHIALYDNSWHAMGGGLSSDVYALALFNNQIWAGGAFASANGSSTFVACLARYNGGSWSGISTPAGIGASSTHVSPRVDSLTVLNGNLYIGGLFDTCAGVPAPGIARFDGVSCHGLDTGITPPTAEVFSMTTYENSVMAMGDFATAGGLSAPNIARWNQTEWSRLDSRPTSPVVAFTIMNGGLVAGGNFNIQTAPGVFARNVASLSSTGVGAFQNAGGFTGTNGPVFAACTVNPALPQLPQSCVIGGQFTSAGGITVNNICSLSTLSSYGAMGSGFNSTVNAVKQFSSLIYAAGAFSASGSTAVNKVAKFVGGAWVPAGTTGVSGGFPNVLEVFNGNLYMGGDFTSVDGVNTGGLARWDGTAWHALSGPFNGIVYSLAVYNGQLIIGGTFPGIQGSVNIVSWDGAAYHPMGFGLGTTAEYISGLAAHNGQLWAAGKFTFAQVPCNLMMWNGLNWNIEDTSMINEGYIDALTSFNGELWAAGYFANSGGHFSSFISRFFCSCYANCDNSTAAPLLNANDFQCFLNQFAFGGDYANCDGSLVNPVLNANDFQCFLNKYVAGCN